jgi:hypothetical protein
MKEKTKKRKEKKEKKRKKRKEKKRKEKKKKYLRRPSTILFTTFFLSTIAYLYCKIQD